MDLIILLFFVAIFCNPLSKPNDEYLSIKQTKVLRGIFSIVVIIHHTTDYVSGNLTEIFATAGYIAVGFFFFMSAYGSVYQLKEKKSDYLESYITKKLKSIVLPYLEITAVYWLYRVIIEGSEIGFVDSLLKAFSIKYIASNCWYVVALIYFYLFFYVGACIAIKTKKNNATLIITSGLFVFVYYLFYALYNWTHEAVIGLHWVYSTMLLLAGTIWGCYEEYLRKNLKLLTYVSTFLAAGINYYERVSNDRWNIVLHNVSAFCYVIIFLFIIRNIRVENRVLAFLGEISFETYMIHGLILKIATNHMGGHNDLLFTTFILAGSLSAAFLLHYLFSKQENLLMWVKEKRKGCGSVVP